MGLIGGSRHGVHGGDNGAPTLWSVDYGSQQASSLRATLGIAIWTKALAYKKKERVR